MKKKFRLKAFFMMLLCILNCGVLCFSFTVAWFTTLTNAASKTDGGFTIKNPIFVESIRYFQFKGKGLMNNDADEYIDFYTTETTNPTDGRNKNDMGYYNLLDSNYQTLMEVTLTDEAFSVGALDLSAVTFATKTHLSADSTGRPDFLLTNEEGSFNSLSSIVDFYVFFEDDIDIDTTTENRIRVIKKDSENYSGQHNFIQNDLIIAGNTISLANLDVEALADQDSEGVAKFYVMLDYDQENCAKMYGNNIGNAAIEEGHFKQQGTDLPILIFEADFEFTLEIAND